MTEGPQTPPRDVLHANDTMISSEETDGDKPTTLASDLQDPRERGATTVSGDAGANRDRQFEGEPEPVHSRLRREDK